MTSRSEIMPTIRPSSTTGIAPILFSPRRRTASPSRSLGPTASTSEPLPRSTDAMVMACLLTRAALLDTPARRRQRANVPRPDPVPTPPASMRQQFWRVFRLLALLSVVAAVIAVVLVTRGSGEVHASLIIATFLGVAASMLLGSALMALMFLSARSGHDEQAPPHISKENEDE